MQFLQTIITPLFLLVTINISAQSVTQEAKDLTPEQKRVQNVESKIEKIKLTYSKDYSYFFDNYPVCNTSERMAKEELNKFIQKNKKALYFAQTKGLQEKCEEINRLKKSINQYQWDECSNINSKIDKLRSNNNWADEKLRKLNIGTAEKDNHESDMSYLDNQVNDLDAILAAEKAELGKQTKKSKDVSLDDFLASKNSNASQGDFLDETNNSAGSDDFLDEINNSSGSIDFLDNSGNNNTDDFLSSDNGTTSENNFEIDYKNSLYGVIDSKGKILIPYKNWKIVEYKMGIAKIKKLIATHKCSSWTYDFDIPYVNAYLVGFVGSDGEFIDGATVEFNSGRQNTIYIVSERARADFNSWSEYEAYKRSVEASTRKKELKKKQCEVDAALWKKSIITNYQ